LKIENIEVFKAATCLTWIENQNASNFSVALRKTKSTRDMEFDMIAQ